MLEVSFRDPMFLCGRSRNVTVAVWHEAPTAVRLRALVDNNTHVMQAYPKGGVFLDIIAAGTPRFTDEIRTATAELVRQTEGYSRGAAHVLMLEGMVGLAVRAFISTVFLVARTKTPTRVFSAVDDASLWLAPLLADTGEPWTSGQLGDLGRHALGQARSSP